MSLRLQEKLLRVVEYGEFERVGSSETIKVNIRLIGAANVDLPSMERAGKFREDLLDRLSFDVITVPPLREIDRASCRERVCQYVSLSVVAGSLKKKQSLESIGNN